MTDRVRRSESWRREFIVANQGRCHYCNRPGSMDIGPDSRAWHLDHMTPLVSKGLDVDENIALACKRCNLAKSAQPYKRFKQFAEQAFWTPDNWRASEADLDHLVHSYGAVAYQEAPWVYSEDGKGSIVSLDTAPSSNGAVESIVVAGSLSDYQSVHSELRLIVDMYRLLPALVAEIRLLRAEVLEAAPVSDVSHLRRDALRTVQKYVRQSVEARLLEIGDGQGCEASAARAFEQGRLQAVDDDAWHALGLHRDKPSPAIVAQATTERVGEE